MNKAPILLILACLNTVLLLAPVAPKKQDPVRPKTVHTEQLVPFSFVDKDLVEIINTLSALKQVTIILPQGANTITQKITYKPTDRDTETLDAAWELLKTFLELAGYSLTLRANTIYVIVRNDDRVNREPLPLYINVPPAQLPNSEQRIRYVYYFTNLKVSDQVTVDALSLILNEMLSTNRPYIFDPKTNALIISDKATAIMSVMRIIGELDVSGFKETVQVIPLFYATANDVKKVFDDLKLAASPDNRGQPFLRADPKAELSTYFPSGTVIQADGRTNSLIVMGKESAVLRINEFIEQYIDVPLDSGASVLHVYDLQYLRASDFAKTLQDIVTRQAVTGGDQSRGGTTGGGPERFFNQVIIRGETVETVTKAEESPLGQPKIDDDQGLAGTVFTNGNRLVIAANQEDWVRIKDLIQKLDKPQPQVIIEVAVVDFRLLDTRAIESTSRNTLRCFNSDNGVDYLASNLSNTNPVLGTNPTTLATDLLSVITNENTTGVSTTIDPGSLFLSLNSPCNGIFGLIQLLSSVMATRIVQSPCVVALNNMVATIKQEILRRVQGEAFTSAGGVPTTPIVDETAKVQVQVLPRISSFDRLSLEIAVTIDEFTNAASDQASSGNKITRRVRTNANLNSGQILVIGGLTELQNTDAEYQTPLIARIPIIGNLFRAIERTRNTTNLTIFVSPTIVQPKLRGGIHAFTADKLRDSRNDISNNDRLFNDLRDPITRFFFRAKDPADTLVKEYLARTNNAPTLEEIKIERRRGKNAVNPVPKEPTGPVERAPFTQTERADQVKALLSQEDSPVSSFKKRQAKNVFYG